jgi:proteinaceous RNase P
VVAEWKEMTTTSSSSAGEREMTLQVHCFVSGASLLQELAAGFRYYVFSKELPLVLAFQFQFQLQPTGIITLSAAYGWM